MRESNLLALDGDLWGELAAARSRFEPFNSPHEGWAVIHEEAEELWKLVMANDGRGPLARREAIQVAAMALRYILDLCEP